MTTALSAGRLAAIACAEAARAWPALSGVRPTAERAGPHHVFTFRGADGAPAVVRVKLDADGRLLRLIASRGQAVRRSGSLT